MKYFKVIGKCGHVRRNNYILKEFYVKAENKKEASIIVKNTPRVKHDHKDAIRFVEEISFDEYLRGKKIMSEDLYFQVHSKQDQFLLCPNIYEFVIKEEPRIKKRTKQNFRYIKYESFIKEKIKELKGGYLYE